MTRWPPGRDARVPGPLRGLVELVYDLEHRARICFIEPLLYRSRYHDPGTQRVCLRPCAEDARPFALSSWRPDRSPSSSIRW